MKAGVEEDGDEPPAGPWADEYTAQRHGINYVPATVDWRSIPLPDRDEVRIVRKEEGDLGIGMMFMGEEGEEGGS